MSIWMDGYKNERINEIMIEKINSDKKIFLDMWPKKKEGRFIFNRNLIIKIREENDRLNIFLNKNGMLILNYQLKKIDYQELIQHLKEE